MKIYNVHRVSIKHECGIAGPGVYLKFYGITRMFPHRFLYFRTIKNRNEYSNKGDKNIQISLDYVFTLLDKTKSNQKQLIAYVVFCRTGCLFTSPLSVFYFSLLGFYQNLSSKVNI